MPTIATAISSSTSVTPRVRRRAPIDLAVRANSTHSFLSDLTPRLAALQAANGLQRILDEVAAAARGQQHVVGVAALDQAQQLLRPRLDFVGADAGDIIVVVAIPVAADLAVTVA